VAEVALTEDNLSNRFQVGREQGLMESVDGGVGSGRLQTLEEVVSSCGEVDVDLVSIGLLNLDPVKALTQNI